MEKLKGQEIQALARVIAAELNKKRNIVDSEKVNAIMKSKEVAAYNSALSALKKKYPNISYGNPVTKANVEYACKSKSYNNTYNNQQAIQDMIILKQLVAKDLESLKKEILKELEK